MLTPAKHLPLKGKAKRLYKQKRLPLEGEATAKPSDEVINTNEEGEYNYAKYYQ